VSEDGLVSKRSIVVAAAGALAVVLLSGCTGMAKCRHSEDEDYPAVEELAQQVMADVPDADLERSGSCDTNMRPNAGVFVHVPGWGQVSDAVSYLRSRGYTFDERSGRSADGRYFADVQGPLRDRGKGVDVAVVFSLAD